MLGGGRRFGGLVWVLLAAVAAALPPPDASAITLLTAAKVGKFKHANGAKVSVAVKAKAAMEAPLPSPLCPAESSFEVALYTAAGGFESRGVIDLDCASWTAQGDGYTYKQLAGSVSKVVLRPNKVVVKAGGPGIGQGIEPIDGPVAYVEAWLTVGGARHLFRFHEFKRNEPGRILSAKPTRAGAAGEAAFWDTLWGIAARSDETLALLTQAVADDPGEGRSHFLAGMMHLYRAGAPADAIGATPETVAEVTAAAAALDQAVELLPDDPRVAGFRAAATFTLGLATGDQGTIDTALDQLADAVAQDPFFNSFDLFATASVIPASDPLYDQILDLADAALAQGACFATAPELCGNAGMAPHNAEGTFVLLGDIAAKAGRLADAQARYGLAKFLATASQYDFQAIVDDRVDTAAARVALYGDGDPANDPLFIDQELGNSCVACHQR